MPIGYSYSNKLAETQDEIGKHLYEFLMQWFTLFPEYQTNPFYAFGESYAGKYIPTISKKIHDENLNAGIKINIKGLGIGNYYNK